MTVVLYFKQHSGQALLFQTISTINALAEKKTKINRQPRNEEKKTKKKTCII